MAMHETDDEAAKKEANSFKETSQSADEENYNIGNGLIKETTPSTNDVEHTAIGGEPKVDSHESTNESRQDGAPAEKVISATRSKASVNDVGAIPNGGLRAWLQVVGAFFLFFNTWGILNTFGAYQTFYETGLLFTSTSSNISWIGSIQAFCILAIGALTGPIYDAGYVRALLWTGTGLIVFGQMMLSLTHNYWQVLLTQALCIGLGTGCLFVPSVAIMSTYFTTRIAFAVGLAASGSSFGGIIYPIVFHKLQVQIGFAWSTRVIGFIMLATQAVPLTVMRVRVLPPKARKLIDLSAFKEPAYVGFVGSSILVFMGIYVPFFYIQYYAISTHITDENLGFYLLSILNTASVFGRIIPNWVADKSGPFNMIVPCAMITGLLILTCISVHSLGSVIAFCIFYGFFSGTLVSLPPACFVSLTKDRGKIGTRMGMGFSIVSVGVLTGAPIAGAILKSKGFVAIWAFGGSTTLGGAMIMFVARMIHSDWKLICKV